MGASKSKSPADTGLCVVPKYYIIDIYGIITAVKNYACSLVMKLK